MLFSVIIPTCNRNDKLQECLDQLKPDVQGLPPDMYEVIVTDDGKDSTAEALIREKYPAVRWVAGPRTGPPGNRNNGAKHAQGEWLVFADDDCIPSSGFLCGYKKAMTPSIVAYEGKITCEKGVNSPLYNAPINLQGGCFWSCNIMLHSDLFNKIGGFDEAFALISSEDTDLRERLKFQKYSIKFVPEALVDHPPRLNRLGTQVGRHHEAEVRMWYLTGNTRASVINVKIFRGIISRNLKDAIKFRFSMDAARMLLYASVEVLYVLTHINGWHKKYKGQFVGVPPPYMYPY